MRFTITTLIAILILGLFNIGTGSCQMRFMPSLSTAESDSIVIDFANRADTTHPVPAHFFGAGFSMFSGTWAQYAWTILMQAGFDNVRFDANLGAIWQSATSKPQWSAIDPTVSFIASMGLKQIMIMDYCPSWLQTSSSDNMPKDVSEWADLAAQVVHHEDSTFPGVVKNYEIWNEPDLQQYLYAPSNTVRLAEYDSIYAAAAPKMYAQALADGDTIKVGGPALANPWSDMNTWIGSLVSDSETAPYVDFVSYHYYPSCSGWSDLSTLIASLGSSGIEAVFNRLALIVRSGKQPDAANTPIYIDEYNASSCPPSDDPIRNSPTYSPVWNGSFVTGLLDAAYDSSHTIPSKLLYFTSTYPSGGFNLLTNNFLPPQPYPQYYLYDLLADTKYLDITDHGYLAHSVSVSTDSLSVSAFYTSNSESVFIVNPTLTNYSGLTVDCDNAGFSPSNETRYLLDSTNATITASALSTTSTANGYQSVVDVPPLSVVALKYGVNTTGIGESGPALPKGFSLEQNYPNPFNPTTTIEYSVAKRSEVKIVVYDILGRMVTTLVNEEEEPGLYKVRFDAVGLPSGVYLCQMSAGAFKQSIKIVLVK